jgi:hypothetical protein
MTIQWDKRGEAEDNPIALMDRVYNINGALVTIASISTITYTSWACLNEDEVISGAGTQVGTSTSCTVASTIYDTLQTAAPWTKDATGYNMRIDLPGSARPAPGWHRIEIIITPVTGSAYTLRWGIKTGALAVS